VRSTERSIDVSLFTCHTCVVNEDETRDFFLIDKNFLF
jgi:hypothetical protein